MAHSGGETFLKLITMFSGTSIAQLVTVLSALFWINIWDKHLFSFKYFRLHSFAKDKNISVRDAVLDFSIQQLFNIPLSEEAYQEFQNLA